MSFADVRHAASRRFPPTLGLVLAGGLARRMGGGDKALIEIGGTTILDRVIARLRPAVTGLILNANGDPARFAALRPAGRRRQRAGFRRSARRHPGRARLGGGACAGDRLGRERAGRLPVPAPRRGAASARGARGGWHAARLCALRRLAPSGGRPVAVALRDDLRRALLDEGLHKIEVWTARHGIAIAEWPATPVDPFFNVNTPDDAAAAERLARLEPA